MFGVEHCKLPEATPPSHGTAQIRKQPMQNAQNDQVRLGIISSHLKL
jgi:hypothetical protein